MRSKPPNKYPVKVPDDSPVLNGLKPVGVKRRNAQLPPLYEYTGDHPGHRIKIPGSKTYVILVDPSPKGKAAAVALENKQVVPNGPMASTSGGFDSLGYSVDHYDRSARASRASSRRCNHFTAYRCRRRHRGRLYVSDRCSKVG